MNCPVEIIVGDNREMLKTFLDNFFDSIVTDPPYELGFMGRAWDKSGIAYDVNLWKECFRVLKPGGHLLAFGGTRTYHRLVCAIEDAGFEIRDQIGWVYGSGFPKSLNVNKSSGGTLPQWEGWGTALKPAWEPIVLARKPLVGTVVENVLAHGTGVLNIDGCRIGYVSVQEAKHQANIAKGQKNATNGTFFGGNGKSVASTETPKGRWPANLIHDGSEDVLETFAKAGESKSGIQRAPLGTGGMWSGKSNNPCGLQYGDTGTPARFFYCAKTTKADRNEGCDEIPFKTAGEVTGGRKEESAGLNSPRAGAGSPSGSRNHHPTVKPTELMRYLCRLVTPPGGIILDPFAGSGSTGKAAVLEGFRFVGIDLSEDYAEIAAARINALP